MRASCITLWGNHKGVGCPHSCHSKRCLVFLMWAPAETKKAVAAWTTMALELTQLILLAPDGVRFVVLLLWSCPGAQSCPSLPSHGAVDVLCRMFSTSEKGHLGNLLALKLHCQDYFLVLPFLSIYKSKSLNYHQENYRGFARCCINLFKRPSAALPIRTMAWFYSWIAKDIPGKEASGHASY